MPIEITKTQLSLENITEYDFASFAEDQETVKIRLGNFYRMTITFELLQQIKECLGWIDFRIREEQVFDAKYTYYYQYHFHRIN